MRQAALLAPIREGSAQLGTRLLCLLPAEGEALPERTGRRPRRPGPKA
jgi:hypothetical protein